MGALPKRKPSHSKTRIRRQTKKATVPALIKCESCGEMKRAGFVCKNCGKYKGKKLV